MLDLDAAQIESLYEFYQVESGAMAASESDAVQRFAGKSRSKSQGFGSTPPANPLTGTEPIADSSTLAVAIPA
jgi:hypothetical protein